MLRKDKDRECGGQEEEISTRPFERADSDHIYKGAEGPYSVSESYWRRHPVVYAM